MRALAHSVRRGPTAYVVVHDDVNSLLAGAKDYIRIFDYAKAYCGANEAA